MLKQANVELSLQLADPILCGILHFPTLFFIRVTEHDGCHIGEAVTERLIVFVEKLSGRICIVCRLYQVFPVVNLSFFNPLIRAFIIQQFYLCQNVDIGVYGNTHTHTSAHTPVVVTRLLSASFVSTVAHISVYEYRAERIGKGIW